MEIFIFSLATMFNFWILAEKVKKGRLIDTIIDLTTMVTLTALFSGTIAGMSIAMVSGMMISIWLWFNPFVISEAFKRKVIIKFYQIMAIATVVALISLFGSKLF